MTVPFDSPGVILKPCHNGRCFRYNHHENAGRLRRCRRDAKVLPAPGSYQLLNGDPYGYKSGDRGGSY